MTWHISWWVLYTVNFRNASLKNVNPGWGKEKTEAWPCSPPYLSALTQVTFDGGGMPKILRRPELMP